MLFLTNKKIKEYLAKSRKTIMFAKYIGKSRCGVLYILNKEDMTNNLTLQFLDFVVAMLDSGAIITFDKIIYSTASRTEINKEAHKLAQEEICRWWENTRGHRKAVAELEARVKKVREEMQSFGI